MTRVAAALTWDGSRFPARQLPARARAFLGRVASSAEMAKILAQGQRLELRVCWVPVLRGGDDVLVPPFATADGKRVAFRAIRTTSFGAVLGVVYRRP